MKKIVASIAFLLFITEICKAQSTLQFSQVLLLSNGSSYTVPSGKVWKITGLTSTSAGATALTLSATINGVTSNFSSYSGSSAASSSAVLPASNIIWLPPGTSISPTGNTRLISVIEFITSP